MRLLVALGAVVCGLSFAGNAAEAGRAAVTFSLSH